MLQIKSVIFLSQCHTGVEISILRFKCHLLIVSKSVNNFIITPDGSVMAPTLSTYYADKTGKNVISYAFLMIFRVLAIRPLGKSILCIIYMKLKGKLQ